jgi:hypothetical protein
MSNVIVREYFWRLKISAEKTVEYLRGAVRCYMEAKPRNSRLIPW